MRSFLKGDRDTVSKFASRLLGSPDIYGYEEREPEQSINFVTCHDGFSLNDLVSYNGKHNEANGEDNRDGSNDNMSWNCGFEGPTDDPARAAEEPSGKELFCSHPAGSGRSDASYGGRG